MTWGAHSGEKRTLGKSREAEKGQKCKLHSCSVQQQLCWWLMQLWSLPQRLQLKSLWGTPSLTSPLTHAVFSLGQSPIPLERFSDTQIWKGRVSLSIQTFISKTQRELVLFLYIGNSGGQSNNINALDLFLKHIWAVTNTNSLSSYQKQTKKPCLNFYILTLLFPGTKWLQSRTARPLEM